jgi:cupin 2 domain-containing protein
MQTGNFLDIAPGALPDEIVDTLAGSGTTRIERIVSRGHSSAPGFWYDQAENEWVLVMKGEARLQFKRDNRIVHLMEGDYVNIPAHEEHRVQWTAEGRDTVWLAVFY